MADWKSRIIEGAIETPDNIRYIFQYGDLEKEIEKKTSKYKFGDTDGSLVYRAEAVRRTGTGIGARDEVVGTRRTTFRFDGDRLARICRERS